MPTSGEATRAVYVLICKAKPTDAYCFLKWQRCSIHVGNNLFRASQCCSRCHDCSEIGCTLPMRLRVLHWPEQWDVVISSLKDSGSVATPSLVAFAIVTFGITILHPSSYSMKSTTCIVFCPNFGAALRDSARADQRDFSHFFKSSLRKLLPILPHNLIATPRDASRICLQHFLG